MIRNASQDDIPQLVNMGVAFLRAHYAGKLVENPAQMEKTVRELMTNPNGRVLVSDTGSDLNGMLAFVVYPHYFSGDLVAGELVWWAEPEARGKVGMVLLHQAEKEAKVMGAKWMQMGAPAGARSAELYKRMGYIETDTTFQRGLQ